MSSPQEPTIERIRAIKQSYERILMAKPNVVGLGIGYRMRGGMRTQDPALVVMVRKKLPPEQLATEDMIPAEIEGVPVDVQEVGELHAQ